MLVDAVTSTLDIVFNKLRLLPAMIWLTSKQLAQRQAELVSAGSFIYLLLTPSTQTSTGALCHSRREIQEATIWCADLLNILFQAECQSSGDVEADSLTEPRAEGGSVFEAEELEEQDEAEDDEHSEVAVSAGRRQAVFK